MHNILIYGLRGCIPLFCQAVEYKKDAIKLASEMLDLPVNGTILSELKKTNYSDCNIPGVEYIEIVKCNCKDMNIHNDL